MSHASFLISVPNCIRHFFYSNQTILKIRIKRFLCQSPLPWGQETLEIVSEMLATILISFFLFHTSNIPWDNFNSMTKQDLCPSEEWPMHSTAGWKEISRRKLCLWQNILSEKSDIQIIILWDCALNLIRHLLLCHLETVLPDLIPLELCYHLPLLPPTLAGQRTPLPWTHIRSELAPWKLSWLFSPFELSGKLVSLLLTLVKNTDNGRLEVAKNIFRTLKTTTKNKAIIEEKQSQKRSDLPELNFIPLNFYSR